MSTWQQYDYDHDGDLEGKEFRDWAAADQKESKEWLEQFHQDMGEARESLQEVADEAMKVAVKQFFDATTNGAHYLILAGEGLAETAVFVAKAAEVVGWLSTAFRWFSYVVPIAAGVADVLDRVENVSEEKAIKASFVALSVALDGLYLASAGWGAMLEGKVTEEHIAQARSVIDRAVEIGQGITDVLFGD